ncbi:MAG: DUF1566 domain-containing protein [Spirochaetales bacterium]|nr:DUF1566 domain-containing protein [Spirochaetales bacterium]
MNKTTVAAAVMAGAILCLCGCQTKTSGTLSEENQIKFVVTDAGQTKCYDNEGNVIDAPEPGELYYGQDAQYQGIPMSFTDNGDGTVTDNNTGLMWQQTPPSDKMFYSDAAEYVENLELGGYDDWRLPTIKESFSIALLDGHLNAEDISLAQPYIDTEFFDFFYDEAKPYTGSYWTSTVCKMPATNDYELMEKNYGFNWADGHLKSYGDGFNIDGSTTNFQIPAGVRAVRGEENVYGVNDFADNGDGTVTDKATGLMWSQQDSGWVNDDGTIRKEEGENFGWGRTWVDTLAWVEKMNEVEYLGYSDWRLPDIKELQSIVQYGKTELPATDPDYFDLSRPDCFVWSSTTCGDFPEMADYVAFGKGYGIDLTMANADMAGGPGSMPPPPGQGMDMGTMPPPPQGQSEVHPIADSDKSVEATIADFVDVHGPGCMRADYKDTNGYVSQAPELSRTFWETLYGTEYPYAYDESNTTTEFDLSFSENAADYIVIYNYALLVRDAN